VNCYGLPSIPDPGNASQEEHITAIMRNRRSTRKYTGREISGAELTSLLEVVGYSPTGHNDQGIHVTVINGRTKVNMLITRPVVRTLRILDPFGLLTLLPGPGRNFLKRLRGGEDLITWGAPCVLLIRAPLRNVTGKADSLIAASMVSIKAEAIGLGTLWNGVVKMIAPFLGLGRCSIAMCVGFPGLRKYQMVPGRNWSRQDL